MGGIANPPVCCSASFGLEAHLVFGGFAMLSRVTAFKRWFAVLVMFALATAARADIEILLQRECIKKHKNRATMDINFVVDKAHKKANPASKDADLHFAGRSLE